MAKDIRVILKDVKPFWGDSYWLDQLKAGINYPKVFGLDEDDELEFVFRDPERTDDDSLYLPVEVHSTKTAKVIKFKIPWQINDIILKNARGFTIPSRLVGDIPEMRVSSGPRRFAQVVRKALFQARKRGNWEKVHSTVSNLLFKQGILQYVDPHNLLSIQSQIRRVYNPTPIRDLLDVYFGRLCPIETPESGKIGTVYHFANDAKVDEEGFIVRPLKTETGEIKYVRALDDPGPVNHPNPTGILSLTVNHLPFFEFNDANRMLMATGHYKQAVQVKDAELPIVRTGAELQPLGRNLLVAYAHYQVTYEDAVVISRSAAKKLQVPIQYKVEAVIDPEVEVLDPDFYAGSRLDKNGVIRLGSYVRGGDILLGRLLKVPLKNSMKLVRWLHKAPRGFSEAPIRVPQYYSGVVVDIEHRIGEDGRHYYRFWIEKTSSTTVGDKLAGRYGNKGVIGKVIPDHEMPKLPDGRPVEMIISPSSVISRMNLGQLIETQLTWLLRERWSEETRPLFEKYLGDHLKFDENGPFILAPAFNGVKPETVVQLGRELGLSSKVKLNGRIDAVVGYQYVLRLHHIASEKYHGRSTGPSDHLFMPRGGRAARGGQRIGEMERWALQAHGAAHFLRELVAVRSDTITAKIDAQARIAAGLDVEVRRYEGLKPMAYHALFEIFNGLGLKPEYEEGEPH